MTERNSVTWKWLAGIAMMVILAGGGAWMGTMNAQVKEMEKEQKADRQTVNEVKGKVGVIEEQTKRTQEDVKEIKEGQKDTIKKLDELLRRR